MILRDYLARHCCNSKFFLVSALDRSAAEHAASLRRYGGCQLDLFGDDDTVLLCQTRIVAEWRGDWQFYSDRIADEFRAAGRVFGV